MTQTPRLDNVLALLERYQHLHVNPDNSIRVTRKGEAIIDELLQSAEIAPQYRALIGMGCSARIARLAVLIAAAQSALENNLLPPLPEEESQ